jgi:protein-S-isoprenylcysteine O-methyltransferase Ste14
VQLQAFKDAGNNSIKMRLGSYQVNKRMVNAQEQTVNIQSSNPRNPNKFNLPKWAVPITWVVIVVVIQVLIPWTVAKLGPHLGWQQARPGGWNIAGLFLVGLGLMSYAYCLLFHFRTYTRSVSLSFAPPHLVKSGPYLLSRNPMYVSGLATWMGWTIYFGSPAVFIALILLWLVFALRVIPHEERLLEELFGEDYLNYKRSVRRWIGPFSKKR